MIKKIVVVFGVLLFSTQSGAPVFATYRHDLRVKQFKQILSDLQFEIRHLQTNQKDLNQLLHKIKQLEEKWLACKNKKAHPKQSL